MKVGLMLPLFEAESGGYANVQAVALAAEASGLDSVWAPDHLNFVSDAGIRGIHECWTTISAIAALTSRIEIGTMVLALPFRNPALTAKMAVQLDVVSSGRLILGLGSGWHEPEFIAFGYPVDHLVSRFSEGLEILVPLLRGERVSFTGQYHQVVDAELCPSPIRPGGPPIMIGAKGPRMLDLAVRHADLWNATRFGPLGDATELRRLLAGLRAALESADRDPSTLGLTVGVFVAFEDAGDDAPANAIRGSSAAIADALAAYADLGIVHLNARVYPCTPDAVRRLGEAVALLRRANA